MTRTDEREGFERDWFGSGVIASATDFGRSDRGCF